MSRVVHFEIHAGDPGRAIAFYEKLFNWKFQKWEGPADYWMIITGADDLPGINGGLVQRRGDIDGQAVTAFVCTIDVTSVDDAVARGLESGGSIALPKMAVPGVGWLAYCKDTEGNIFGVMQRDSSAQ